jgi:hypothetical protein
MAREPIEPMEQLALSVEDEAADIRAAAASGGVVERLDVPGNGFVVRLAPEGDDERAQGMDHLRVGEGTPSHVHGIRSAMPVAEIACVFELSSADKEDRAFFLGRASFGVLERIGPIELEHSQLMIGWPRSRVRLLQDILFLGCVGGEHRNEQHQQKASQLHWQTIKPSEAVARRKLARVGHK